MWRVGPADWNADISDGEDSSYAVRVPDDDAASQASAQGSQASSNAAQPPKKQPRTEAYKPQAERGSKGPRPSV
eukprot:8199583-Alexandrium_andersonii.AAC.1